MTLALGLALLQQTVRYDLSERASFTYDVTQTFKTPDGSEETTTLEIWTYRFLEALNGGAAKLQLERATTAMVVDGRRIEIRSMPQRGTELRSPRGDVRERQPASQIEPAFELRLARIGDIEFPSTPLRAGTTWERESKPTDDGLPAAKWSWTADELRGGRISGTFRFSESGVDPAIQAEGKFVSSLADGWPFELTFKAVNTHQLGDEERLPTVYSFTMKRR
jgi:hypothetical protein